MKLKSNSKINLALWIKEKRVDGYHELETIFYENKDLYDEIEIEILDDVSEEVEVSFLQNEFSNLIPQQDNLAYKAARLFFEKTKLKKSCKIRINKNIPLQAGLGGGSSNAASVLKGLNKLSGDKLNESELLNIASILGSDVPFFILGGICLGKGKGEILEKFQCKLAFELKIAKPANVSVSTKWAYEQIDAREFFPDHSSQMENLMMALKDGNYNSFIKNIFNDFESVVFSFYPELINLRKKLLNEGYDCVGLCGSGSALFAVKIAAS